MVSVEMGSSTGMLVGAPARLGHPEDQAGGLHPQLLVVGHHGEAGEVGLGRHQRGQPHDHRDAEQVDLRPPDLVDEA